MKRRHSFLFQIAAIAALVWPAVAHAQSSFQNLGFESATLMPIPGDAYNRVYFDAAFPGWVGFVGGNHETRVLTNTMFLCCSAISLWTSGTAPPPAGLIEGQFGIGLQGARRLENGQVADSTIAQTGVIPVDAQSLQFRAQIYGGPLEVKLSGQGLSLMPLVVTPNYTVYGADISPWAGQERELQFTATGHADPLADSLIFLDSIQFSTTPVPEPSTVALFGLSAVLGWFFWRRRTR